jgi:hypothetical protein
MALCHGLLPFHFFSSPSDFSDFNLIALFLLDVLYSKQHGLKTSKSLLQNTSYIREIKEKGEVTGHQVGSK